MGILKLWGFQINLQSTNTDGFIKQEIIRHPRAIVIQGFESNSVAPKLYTPF